MMLHRILRSDHQKRLRQFIRLRIHCNLTFIHRLEQRRLRLRSSAIDFVRQQNIGKHRTALELELLLQRRIHRNAKQVRRQHVAGELHPLKAAINGASQSLSQRSLAHARNALNQKVSTRKNADQRQPDDIVLPANHAPQRPFQLFSFVRCGNSNLRRH